MPNYERFEDLPVWKEASTLYHCALDLMEEHGAIRKSAESCLKQLTGWIKSIECGPIRGKRHQVGDVKGRRKAPMKPKPRSANIQPSQ